MYKKFLYQQGYGGLSMLFLGLVFAAVSYVFFYPPSFLKPHAGYISPQCYMEPSSSSPSFTDTNGDKYILIKKGAPTIRAQVDYHYGRQADIALPPTGKKYPYYKVWFDSSDGSVQPAFNPSNTPGRGGGHLGAGSENLRFVDTSVDFPNVDKAYAIMDIYLLAGKPVPDFVLNYCNQELPIIPLLRIQDTDAVSFPPLEFNSGEPSAWKTPSGPWQLTPLPNKKYVMFAYDIRGSDSFALSTNQSIPTSTRQYTFTSDGKTATYNAYFLINGSLEQISLVNADPNAEDANIGYKYTRYELGPQILSVPNLHNKSPHETATEHLEAFVPFQIPPWGWWTPECKPAVYLYPPKDTLVNVKVNITNGFLTYTDPLYPKDSGWNVLAHPNGDLNYLLPNLADSFGKTKYPTGVFPYLYYEGKVQDRALQKPNTGFVEKYDDLSKFFDNLLPKLGLNAKETTEFKSYWLKALPKSPYYFIGIVPQNQLDATEPLTISPKQDTLIRVRLFFQQLEQPSSVDQPQIQTPTRNGFTVVDWGAYVKNDRQHPFTCVQ